MDPERIRAALQLETSDRAGGWIGGTGLEKRCRVGAIQAGDIRGLVPGSGKCLERCGGCNLGG